MPVAGAVVVVENKRAAVVVVDRDVAAEALKFVDGNASQAS